MLLQHPHLILSLLPFKGYQTHQERGPFEVLDTSIKQCSLGKQNFRMTIN